MLEDSELQHMKSPTWKSPKNGKTCRCCDRLWKRQTGDFSIRKKSVWKYFSIIALISCRQSQTSQPYSTLWTRLWTTSWMHCLKTMNLTVLKEIFGHCQFLWEVKEYQDHHKSLTSNTNSEEWSMKTWHQRLLINRKSMTIYQHWEYHQSKEEWIYIKNSWQRLPPR